MSIHSVTRHWLRSGLAAGALIVALGSTAGAQTVLPELLVVSPSLVPIEASKTGSSVFTMTGDEARATGFSQLSDVMRTFPGMHVSQSGARGSLTQFRVRGAEANHLLVVIDGVPADLPFCGPGGSAASAGDLGTVEKLISDVGLSPLWIGGLDAADTLDGVLRLWYALAVDRNLGRRLAFRALTG